MTMSESIRILELPEDLEQAFSVMRELRKTLGWGDFLSLYKSAKERDHYEIVGITEGGKVVAVMGYDYVPASKTRVESASTNVMAGIRVLLHIRRSWKRRE